MTKDIGHYSCQCKVWKFWFDNFKCKKKQKKHAFTSRTQLAALHFNENSTRGQAQTQDGNLRYKISFPKHKRGDYIVRVIKENPTYGKHITIEFTDSIKLLRTDSFPSCIGTTNPFRTGLNPFNHYLNHWHAADVLVTFNVTKPSVTSCEIIWGHYHNNNCRYQSENSKPFPTQFVHIKVITLNIILELRLEYLR